MLAAMTHAPMEKGMETLMAMKRPKPDPVLEAQLDRAFTLSPATSWYPRAVRHGAASKVRWIGACRGRTV